MSCCGNKRSSLHKTSAKLSDPVITGEVSRTKRWKDILFEYTGDSSFVVRGFVTGQSYHFPDKGSVQVIDYRDASGFHAEPLLKRIT